MTDYKRERLIQRLKQSRTYFPHWDRRMRLQWAERRTELDMRLAGLVDSHGTPLSFVPIAWERAHG